VTREDVMREIAEHLATRKPTDPLIRLDNWAAMAGLTYRELYGRTRWKQEYRDIIEQYMAASRAYHEAVHAELRAAGANHIAYLRPIAEKFDIPMKTLRNKARRLCLANIGPRRISVAKCVAHAQVGMTLAELAQATGYKDYSLANLIPRKRFAGLIEFALRQVIDSSGCNRRRLVITHVGKPRKRS
jgi:hypothetical protein